MLARSNRISEASPRTDKSMNRVSLCFDLEIKPKPKFNDPVIPAWIRHSIEVGNGIQCHGWRLIARKYLLLDSRLRGNDASLSWSRGSNRNP
uniref:Uncharacterized protein n=1 Tax=Candidatus Kentrum sp. UNK TaxID=2126344 RepID=A0A451ALN6_9GAMM|nr:MAG: hypothetical protein BECKUNK1418G_GA0071005_11184 [Candidatus Kentron sp. UNK]VFK72060.1 MAG: hypothetical protein BECKUNK1418H_GA0071006_10946 [Candidatus Kentron sp. UNK]